MTPWEELRTRLVRGAVAGAGVVLAVTVFLASFLWLSTVIGGLLAFLAFLMALGMGLGAAVAALVWYEESDL